MMSDAPGVNIALMLRLWLIAALVVAPIGLSAHSLEHVFDSGAVDATGPHDHAHGPLDGAGHEHDHVSLSDGGDHDETAACAHCALTAAAPLASDVPATPVRAALAEGLSLAVPPVRAGPRSVHRIRGPPAPVGG